MGESCVFTHPSSRSACRKLILIDCAGIVTLSNKTICSKIYVMHVGTQCAVDTSGRGPIGPCTHRADTKDGRVKNRPTLSADKN